MPGNVEQYKESISDRYIKDFKKELGFFEKAMVLPIEKKMKEILKSDKKIDVSNLRDLEDLGFWRKVLGVKIGQKQLFDKLMTKTFNFLKEKQEKIIQAQTEGRLDELSELVINGKLDLLEQRVNDQNQGGDQTDQDNNQQEGEQGGDNGGDSGEGEQNQGDDGKNDEGNGKEGNDNAGDNRINSVGWGVTTGVGASATYYAGLRTAEKNLGTNVLKNVPENFDGAYTKTMMEKMTDQMKVLKDNPKLNSIQRCTYEKSIKNFEKAAASMDTETEAAFKTWQKMGSKMPPDFLTRMNVDRKVVKMIEDLPEEDLVKLLSKGEGEIVETLGKRGIKISEEFAKTMKIARNVGELKGVLKMAKCGTKLSNVLKGIKGMGMITFLMMGFDIWMYCEGKNEAELVAKVNEARGQAIKDKATVQLWIGIGSVVLEALSIVALCALGGSATGPWGTVIGVAVGVLAAITSMAYDGFIGDVKEFYAQNRYDFVSQSRPKVKQSIVQLLESDRRDLDEWMKRDVREVRGPNSDANTLEDACEALIFHEECIDGGYYMMRDYYHSGESEEGFLKKKADELKEQYKQEEGESLQSKIDGMKKEYKEEKEKLEGIIKIRMDYVKKYITENHSSPEYISMKKKLEANQGMEYVEQVLADSKVYATIQKDIEDPYVENYKNLSVDQYKEAYKNKLKADYPKEFEIFDNLSRTDPYLLCEICTGTKTLQQEIQMSTEDSVNEAYSQVDLQNIKKNLSFVEKFDEYYNLGRPPEKKLGSLEGMNGIDYSYIEKILADNFESINKRPSWDKKQTLNYMYADYYRTRLETKYDISDSLTQNIMYSIAVECHGYSGRNDLYDLINFYNEGDKKNLGIYYDERRRFSNNWWHDWEVTTDINELDTKTPGQLQHIFTHGDIDSPVGAADDKLSIELGRRTKEVIMREVGYRQNKKQYEQNIIDFIKENASGDSYVELPYSLMVAAKKAGIGPIEHYLFRIDNGVIVAISCGDSADEVLHFDTTGQKIKYEATTPLRDKLTKEETDLINSVDVVCDKINKMREVEMDEISGYRHTDELDISIQLERIMSKKVQDWEKEKDMVYYMSPAMTQQYFLPKAEEYYNYFDGLYRGFLTTITSFKHANDINDVNQFNMCMSWTDQFDIVSINKEGKYKFNDSVPETIRKLLPDLFEYYKDESTGKTVKELLHSKGDDADKEKARGQFLARQIYTICMEEAVLHYRNGNLDDFYVNGDDDITVNQVKIALDQRMKEFTFFNAYDVASKDVNDEGIQQKEKGIREVTKGEKDFHGAIEVATKNIIKTMDMVDREYKRGDPTFEADVEQKEDGKVTGILKTWGSSERITVITENGGESIKAIKVDGLDMEFTNVHEGFRVANLINWIKKNRKDNPKGKGATGYIWSTYDDYMWYDGKLDMNIKGSRNNIVVVKESTISSKFPTIKNSQRFLNYINKF